MHNVADDVDTDRYGEYSISIIKTFANYTNDSICYINVCLSDSQSQQRNLKLRHTRTKAFHNEISI